MWEKIPIMNKEEKTKTFSYFFSFFLPQTPEQEEKKKPFQPRFFP
jgi:hypothetical protein